MGNKKNWRIKSKNKYGILKVWNSYSVEKNITEFSKFVELQNVEFTQTLKTQSTEIKQNMN